MFKLPLSKWNNVQMSFLSKVKKKKNESVGSRVLIMWSAEIALILSVDVRIITMVLYVGTWPHLA